MLQNERDFSSAPKDFNVCYRNYAEAKGSLNDEAKKSNEQLRWKSHRYNTDSQEEEIDRRGNVLEKKKTDTL